MTVLRAGTNGFTCMPGDPTAVAQPCPVRRQASMQWSRDFAEHKPKPTNTIPGITYVLAGATQRKRLRPFDTQANPSRLANWMIMWPFDPKTTDYDNAQADGSLHHVRRITLRACAHHGTPVEVSTSKQWRGSEYPGRR